MAYFYAISIPCTTTTTTVATESFIIRVITQLGAMERSDNQRPIALCLHDVVVVIDYVVTWSVLFRRRLLFCHYYTPSFP